MAKQRAAEQSQEQQAGAQQEQGQERFEIGLLRAFGGTLIFSLPLMMTMEMWFIAFYIDRLRLALFLALTIPLLVGLSYHAGFEKTLRSREDLRDAIIAFAVGATSAACILSLLGILTLNMPLDEIVGKVSLLAVPGSIGALLARSQLGGGKAQAREKGERGAYFGELFLMGVGALFLAFNIAPTEEVVLLAQMMTSWHAVALAIVSIAIMHVFAYMAAFRGQASVPPGTSAWSIFLRFTVAGYAIVLLISLYVLWTFGRMEGASPEQIISMALALGFPGAIGAAAARLIL